MNRPVIDSADAKSSVHGMTILLILFALTIGVFTVAGGESRWDAEAFETALGVPGAPESWGYAIAALAVIAALGYWTWGSFRTWFWNPRYVLSSALFGIAIWSLSFGLAFLREYFARETVSMFGAALFFLLAVIYIHTAILFLRGKNA